MMKHLLHEGIALVALLTFIATLSTCAGLTSPPMHDPKSPDLAFAAQWSDR